MPTTFNNPTPIYFETVGQGSPLLLHHGNTSSLKTWYQWGYVEPLAKHFQLILMDARGHGRSGKPHDPQAYTLEKRTRDVISVLDTLNIKHCFYFGYSMGGWTGFGLMKYFPERFSAFVLGGGHPYGSSELVNAISQSLKQGLPSYMEELEKRFGKLPAFIKKELLSNDVEALIAANTLPRADISDCLANIKVPCLLYAGENDPVFPLVKQSAESLPNSKFIALPDLDHVQALWQNKWMLESIIDFLRQG